MNDYKHLYESKTEYEKYLDTERHGNALVSATLLAIGITIGVLGMGVVRSCTPPPTAPSGGMDCCQCHTKIAAYTDYFRRSGSKSPQQMAEAVLSTRNPRLMAAVAKIETNGNPNIRKAGYRKRHDGAFQVNPKDWGKVSHDPVEQALQAERIIQELTTDHKDIRKALSVYGGDSSSRYGRKILAELVRVP